MSDICKFKAGNLVFELDASDEKGLFEKIAHIQEVFDQSCGKCQSDNVILRVRTVDDNKFYEMTCKDCYARLSFGAHKKGGTLFPKRKGEGGEFLNDYGWLKWNPETKTEE